MEGGGVLRIDRFIHKLDHRGKGGFFAGHKRRVFPGELFGAGIGVP